MQTHADCKPLKTDTLPLTEASRLKRETNKNQAKTYVNVLLGLSVIVNLKDYSCLMKSRKHQEFHKETTVRFMSSSSMVQDIG